jgi:hypothetical protein
MLLSDAVEIDGLNPACCELVHAFCAADDAVMRAAAAMSPAALVHRAA